MALGLADDLAERLGPAVTVHSMVAGGMEISIGVVRDATFGPLMVIVAASQLATELGGALEAIEANPVIASATGVVTVDALVIPRSRRQRTNR